MIVCDRCGERIKRTGGMFWKLCAYCNSMDDEGHHHVHRLRAALCDDCFKTFVKGEDPAVYDELAGEAVPVPIDEPLEHIVDDKLVERLDAVTGDVLWSATRTEA